MLIKELMQEHVEFVDNKNIDIFEKNIEVELSIEPIQCSNDNGSINVQVNNVNGDYIYQLLKKLYSLNNINIKITNKK